MKKTIIWELHRFCICISTVWIPILAFNNDRESTGFIEVWKSSFEALQRSIVRLEQQKSVLLTPNLTSELIELSNLH